MGETTFLDAPASDAARGSPAGIRESGPKRPFWGKILWSLAVVSAFGAGWVLAGKHASRQEREGLPPAKGMTERDPETVVVTAEPVRYRTVRRTVEGMGTLHGFEEVTIAARVEGFVRKIRFDVADLARPGDLLVEIDPTDAELAVQQAVRGLEVELAKLGLSEPPAASIDLNKVPSVVQARTRMENTQSRQDRARRLVTTGSISPEDVTTATSDYRAARAEHDNQLLLAKAGLATVKMKQTALAVARQQLADTRVKVPTPTLPVPGSAPGGVTYAVAQRAVSEGSLVRPGTEICKLVLNRTLKLRTPIPERYGAEVRLGQKAEVRTASLPHPLAGTVTRINPTVDPATRTFEVEIQVPNVRGESKSGSFAKAAILTRTDAEAVTVPLSALVSFAGITKLFAVENGRAKEVQVTPGIQTTEWVEIATPALPRGTRVITSGQSVLADSTPVALRAEPAPAEGREGTR